MGGVVLVVVVAQGGASVTNCPLGAAEKFDGAEKFCDRSCAGLDMLLLCKCKHDGTSAKTTARRTNSIHGVATLAPQSQLPSLLLYGPFFIPSSRERVQFWI